METAQPVIVTSKNRLREIATEVLTPIVKEAVRELLPDNSEPDAKAFLTNEEACRYLGLAKPTLARYRADGTLPFHKVGSSVYYRREDVEALIERGRVTK